MLKEHERITVKWFRQQLCISALLPSRVSQLKRSACIVALRMTIDVIAAWRKEKLIFLSRPCIRQTGEGQPTIPAKGC